MLPLTALKTLALSFVFLWFFWFYHVSTVVLAGSLGVEESHKPAPDDSPEISLLVPARGEADHLGRLLDELKDLDYPDYEIITILGESDRGSRELCEEYRRENPELLDLVQEESSRGKPHALNVGLEKASGEIIGVLDADARVTDRKILKKAAGLIKSGEAKAVQGKISLNGPDSTVTSKLAYLTRYLFTPSLLRGGEKLGGFVPLCGTNQYIERTVLERVGGWDGEALTEDVDMSLQLLGEGVETAFSSDIEISEQPPADLRAFLKQAFRQARGLFQALKKHFRDLLGLGIGWVGVVVMLLSPLIAFLGLSGFSILLILGTSRLSAWLGAALGAGFLGGVALSAVALASLGTEKLYYLPLLFPVWVIFSGIGICSSAAEISGLSKKWRKTRKAGGTSGGK